MRLAMFWASVNTPATAIPFGRTAANTIVSKTEATVKINPPAHVKEASVTILSKNRLVTVLIGKTNLNLFVLIK